jgi:chromosome segregation ATPase
MKQLFILPIAFLAVFGCVPKEKVTQLQAENDSLRKELETSQLMLFSFKEVGSLIDSIDENRNALRVNIIEGTPYFSYTERLEEINSYVKRSEQKIDELENNLRTSHNETDAYQMMIVALKDELSISVDEIRAMEARVNKVLKENKNLNQTVKIQQGNLEDFQLQLDAKYHEVKLFELQIQELTDKLQITEANAYFAQAQALELAARKTRLAPNKKRETYREALDLYSKAKVAGHPEAQARITELEKRL